MRRWLFLLIITGLVINGYWLYAGYGENSDNEKKDEIIKTLAGSWSGHGAGEEVRFRHKLGLLTLTVKHKTEFVFYVNEKGEIEGEGSIEFDLTNNTTGLDNLVASVHALMGLAPTPGVIKGPSKDKSPGAQDVAKGMGDQIQNVEGVTKIQYEAPHLKHGKEIRHFKFKGRIRQEYLKDKWNKEVKKIHVYIDTVKDFTLPGGKPNNTLIAEYEVNKVKTESNFPCWSPFLKAPGVVRKGPGKIHIAEFMKKGTHRNNKNVWQEYGYIWMARQISPESSKNR